MTFNNTPGLAQPGKTPASWMAAINALVGGTGSQVLVAGGFALWAEWDTDADVDLYVVEPGNNLYAPYAGVTTPNGFFSGDSANTGYSFEYYAAADQIEPGNTISS